MITLNYKPYHLPQINMPDNEIFARLDDENVDYEALELHPTELKPCQGVVFSDEINALDDEKKDKPIWVSVDNEICDGHHRYVSHLIYDKPINCVKVNMKTKDCCRLLNKIQDIYEYEQKHNIEEMVHQTSINYRNKIDGEGDFTTMLEQDNLEVNDLEKSKNNKKITAYRKNELKENSKVGNFFMLKPHEGFTKYEIVFENLLNTNDFGLEYKNAQSPTDVISRLWFPNINFQNLSEKYDMPVEALKNRAITERAKKMGYDGIQYSDLIVQGLK